jgi:ABC-type amino acid transport substrate-binding protein
VAKFDFSAPYLSANEVVAVRADQQPSLFQVFRTAFLNWSLLVLFLFIVVIMIAGSAVLWLLEHKGDSAPIRDRWGSDSVFLLPDRKSNAAHYAGKDRRSFGRSLFWSTMVLSGRDLPKAIGWSTVSPATFAGRLFGIIWMIVGIMLTSIFTATAASVLTSRQLQSIVNSPDDLRRVKVGTVSDSVAHEYLKHQQIKCNNLYPGPLQMLKGLTDHQYDAAVYNSQIMSYYARTAFTNKIVVLRFSLRQDFLAIPMRPGSNLRKPINEAMLQVLESKEWQTILARYLGND